MTEAETPKSAGEKIYDEEIAPLLKQVGELCVKHNFPFIARVQYERTDTDSAVGDTFFVPEHTAMKTLLAFKAMKANANVDLLIGWIEKQCVEKGHSSIYMHFIAEYRKMLGADK